VLAAYTEARQNMRETMTTVELNGATYSLYRKASTQPLRPYVPGEDLTGVSVSEQDTPAEGGMTSA